MQGDEKGKRVMITGATRGLGRAMAEGFAALGWLVSGCGRDEEALKRLRAALPQPHWFAQADLASDPEVERFVKGALERHGAPDLLLNNGAIINRNATLWEVSDEEFAHIVNVNIKGVASVIRYAVPAMIERHSGVIINFSSGWGRSTSPEVAPYCASKWAIEGLSAALAQELPKGLAAAALNPGVINTDMLQRCFGADANGYPDARAWATKAVPFLAALDARCNGRVLTAPQV